MSYPMNQVRPSYEQFPRVISSSSRGLMSICPQSYYREVICGLRLKEANFHLDAGKAYAVGLETTRTIYYDPSNSGIPEADRAEIAQARGLEAFIKSYGPDDPPENQNHKNLRRMAGAFAEYFIHFPMATDKMQPMRNADGTPAVEFSFVFDIPGTAHPVTGEPILYSGRADMLAEWNKGIWVYDDKTASQMGANWRTQWELRSQFTGYIYAAQQHNINPVGAVVRGMCIPKVKGEPNYRHEEAFVTRTAPQVERWIDRLRHDVDRMIWYWNHDYWPHYGEENNGCNNYGSCAMRTLCSAADPNSIKDMYYKTYRWDPIEGKEIKQAEDHPAIERFANENS